MLRDRRIALVFLYSWAATAAVGFSAPVSVMTHDEVIFKGGLVATTAGRCGARRRFAPIVAPTARTHAERRGTQTSQNGGVGKTTTL